MVKTQEIVNNGHMRYFDVRFLACQCTLTSDKLIWWQLFLM